MTMTLIKKIALPFIVLAIMILAVLSTIYVYLDRQLLGLVETREAVSQVESRIERLTSELQTGILGTRDAYFISAAEISLEIEATLLDLSAREPELMSGFLDRYYDFYSNLVGVSSVFLEQRLEEGQQRLAELGDARAEISATVSAANAELAARYQTNVDLLNRLMFATAVLMILVLIGALWWVKILIRPLDTMRAHVDSIAAGNLGNHIVSTSRDEIGMVMARLADMQSRLGDLIGRIVSAVDSISTGTREIAKGNTDLSQRTEEQASSLEQTASSMEELTATVRQNADNAKNANALSNDAERVATEGGEKAREVMESMRAITASSEKIGDIIGVIDSIAFQTNILALNAAVEAARAGEQGRGFAVVAGEVRTLAQRSAAAAKEIRDLIAEDGKAIEQGSRRVEEAVAAMSEIAVQVKRVSDLIGEIAAASEEQSRGIEQVNTAVSQMDEVTQQNAALVEQAAAAAESLEEQAQELAAAASYFRTGVSAPMAATSIAQLPPPLQR